ncbi:YycH protein [Fructilactobacillus florum 8D]|uniref:YycH protein n=2 Tax=Fructilactobacillus florum TaxID=640331 RepID=W9EJ96_9LACO|nr:two-component system activity regulator YycH [Fructilactobacillus florum]ETO41060.1 YycH protein [Fructilactobacillus florum 8D]
MKEKLRHYFLPGMVGIAVIISIILSVSLLTNPARFSSRSHQNRTTDMHNDNNTHNELDLYAPTQLIETTSTGQQNLVTSPTTNLIGEVLRQLRQEHFSAVKQISTNNQKQYQAILHKPNTMSLNYTNPISTDKVAKLLRYQDLNGLGQVSRLVVPIDEPHELYLLADENQTVYRVSLATKQATNFKKFLQHGVTKNRVEVKFMNRKPWLFFPNPVIMNDYAFMLQEQSQSSYLNRVIGNATNANVKHRQGKTTYSSPDQELTFDHNDNVTYNNYRPTKRIVRQEDALNAAYQNAIQLGIPLDNTKFDSYVAKDHTVVYRLFIEGFPLFSDDQLGTYTYRYINQNSEQYQFSLRDFQIPIPTDDSKTTLPNTSDVLATLQQRGLSHQQLQGMTLGYQVVTSKADSLVVTLQPTWFVKYDNQWVNYQVAGLNNNNGKE